MQLFKNWVDSGFASSFSNRVFNDPTPQGSCARHVAKTTNARRIKAVSCCYRANVGQAITGCTVPGMHGEDSLLGTALFAANDCWLHGSKRRSWVPRHSHSRPQNVPQAKRERMLDRPKDTFKRHTGLAKGRRQQLDFAKGPLDSSLRKARSARNPRFGHWRRKLKESRTEEQSLRCLKSAVQKGVTDSSVLGSAMQKCGYSRWCTTLSRCITCNGIARYHRTLSNAESCWQPLHRASRMGLSRMQFVMTEENSASSWEFPFGRSCPNQFDFEPAIGNAWSSCTAIGPEALSWARGLAR